MTVKLKTEVRINDSEGASDIDLDLTFEQSVKLLAYLVRGDTVHLNLVTPPPPNGRSVLDDPKAYAE